MKNSLAWRFLIILVIVALAAWLVMIQPLRLGIDLAGGTSLLYELDLSKVQSSANESTSTLANRVVAVLKKRVDPNGQKNFIWRVIGDKRIQIQMPQPDDATKKASLEDKEAKAALDATSLKSSIIQHLISLPAGPERDKEIDAILPPDHPTATAPAAPAASAPAPVESRNALLKKLANARDVLLAAKAREESFPVGKVPPSVMQAKITAEDAYKAATKELDSANVDVSKLQSLLLAADDPKNSSAQSELAAFPAAYPGQRAAIERFIAAHKKLDALSGGGVVDPNDLKRLITAAGVLDFRITVAPAELGGPAGEAYQSALESLKKYGPSRQISLLGTHARWFEIDPNGRDNFGPNSYVLSVWASQPYVLCFDDTFHALAHDRPLAWSATAKSPQPSESGLELPFNLDPIGAKYMGELTGDNKQRQMAILLDDRAMSAPTIQSRITDSGRITFGTGRSPEAVKKEAEDLKQIMDSGSLPAALQKDPISVVEITSDMGEDNVKAGLWSGIYALLAVLGFMVVYYTITGAFANLALMINLLLVLAVMGRYVLDARFTLPGIAGLVLTLGMAVDANVLINERIREEIHKGASLWMAVKQGYDKVFWTIFDANLTTSLTSIVLIYVGSEEVKGFGVTLLIGLMIHMFTALFVTRTLMMGAIKVGIIRAIDDHSITEYLREIFTLTWLRNGHWPFMKVITVTKIDWIGKRHIFWGVSAVVMIAGLAAFIVRGDDKYDIEFRGGTEVILQLNPTNPGAPHLTYLTREQVADRVHALASSPGLQDLREARIYGVGAPDKHRFAVETTIADTSTVKLKTKLLEALADKFHDVLDVTRKVTVKNGDVSPKLITDLIDNLGIVRPIDAPTLDQVFTRTNHVGILPHDVTDQAGGVAILLEDINPPLTASQLADRIRLARSSQDPALKNIPNRNSHVIPLATADGRPVPDKMDDDTVPLTRAVVVSKDDNQPYDEASEAVWQSLVASTEWQVVQSALATESLFQGVTSFDAVVAGQAKIQALTAIILSLILIVAYVWIRFGGIRYGLGAIFSLVHDAIVALAATVLAKYFFEAGFGKHLLITDFKINLTMIAAYLTVIGYSVNDTIVIFDRVRELRGKSNAPLTAKLVNDAINQCFGRTIWTTFTVFIVVLIMYIFGGDGVRGFSYAMLIGVFTGAYSTLAIASPMLLATASDKDKQEQGIQRVNPFRKPEVTEKST